METHTVATAWRALQADTYRQYGEYSLGRLIKGAITRRTFRAVVTMRLCRAVAIARYPLRGMLPLLKLVHGLATHLAAIDLPWEAEVGGGIALTHGWGLVVSRGATIGSNVTLFHGVTIGRRDRIAPDGTRLTQYPVIENDVWIGPHAIIAGGVRIGRGSRIAGGAFVTQSVPPYSVVSGNPASVVKSDCTPDVMNQAPIFARGPEAAGPRGDGPRPVTP